MKLHEVFVTLLVAFAAVACKSTCEEAREKFESCEDEIARAHMGQSYSVLPFAGVSDECNEQDQCVAPCILDADCAVMAHAIAKGMQVDPNNPPPDGAGTFTTCVLECFGK